MNCKKNAPIVWQLFQRRRWEKSQTYHCIVKKKHKKTKKKNSFFHEILAAKSNPLDPKHNPLASCHTLSLLFILFQGLECFTYKLFFSNSARLGTTKCLYATSGHFYICPLSDVTSNFSCVEPWPINLRYFGTTKVRAILSNDILSHLNNHCYLIFCSFIPCQLYNRNILSTRGFW